jgi:hypothetical protein
LIEKIESKNSSTLFLVKVAAEEDKEGWEFIPTIVDKKIIEDADSIQIGDIVGIKGRLNTKNQVVVERFQKFLDNERESDYEDDNGGRDR